MKKAIVKRVQPHIRTVIEKEDLNVANTEPECEICGRTLQEPNAEIGILVPTAKQFPEIGWVCDYCGYQLETSARISRIVARCAKKYDPPYTIEEIKYHYPDKAEMLLKDSAHHWRAETGIELIHKEPNLEEQRRIWENWQLMPKNLKEESDQKSLELFGITNAEHHRIILKNCEFKSALKKASLNVLENYDKVLQAIGVIEGDRWLERQKNLTKNSEFSLPYIYEKLLEKQQELSEYKKELALEKQKVNPDIEEIIFLEKELNPKNLERTLTTPVYGEGGFNRYFIRLNGDVIFSKYHSDSKNSELAQNLGFIVL